LKRSLDEDRSARRRALKLFEPRATVRVRGEQVGPAQLLHFEGGLSILPGEGSRNPDLGVYGDLKVLGHSVAEHRPEHRHVSISGRAHHGEVEAPSSLPQRWCRETEGRSVPVGEDRRRHCQQHDGEAGALASHL
jgi:hypothetical protein